MPLSQLAYQPRRIGADAARIAANPGRLAVAVLAAALFLQGALLVRSLGGTSRSSLPLVGAAAHASRPTPGSIADEVVRAHLFGAAPASVAREDAQAAVPAELFLTGTIAFADPSRGFAILGESRQSTRLFAAGGAVSSGVTLREVYADRAVLERSGARITLWLPGSGENGRLQRVARNRTALDAANVPGAPHTEPPMPAEISQALARENSHLGGAFVEKPLMNLGLFAALTVDPGPDGTILRRLGLKPGDVIQGVDGILIDLEHVNLFREALASGRTVSVEVLRPREGSVRLDIDSSQLAGMVAN